MTFLIIARSIDKRQYQLPYKVSMSNCSSYHRACLQSYYLGIKIVQFYSKFIVIDNVYNFKYQHIFYNKNWSILIDLLKKKDTMVTNWDTP